MAKQKKTTTKKKAPTKAKAKARRKPAGGAKRSTRPAKAGPGHFVGMTGAKLFSELLLAEGVEHLFGIPGGVVLPIFDSLYDSPIEFVLTRHEQGAAHMADGYARSTGKVGVCIATSGPGATNLVTGLATASMDSVPVVAFTGQVKSSLIGNDAFQEADTTGITRPVTKHNMLVRRVEDLGRAIGEAFHIARTGRPGPVLVDMAVDATTTALTAEPDLAHNLPGYKPRLVGHARQIRAAAEAINAAERPVLYVGGGVIISGASDLLTKLAHKGGIPVTTTLMAMGAFDETDPLAVPCMPRSSTWTSTRPPSARTSRSISPSSATAPTSSNAYCRWWSASAGPSGSIASPSGRSSTR